jgi:hypothetical protein
MNHKKMDCLLVESTELVKDMVQWWALALVAQNISAPVR